MFLLMILVVVFVSLVVRLVTFPLRFAMRRRFFGYGYGYNPYRYGCRRHHGLVGRVLPILVLVALDRMFTRRF